MSGGGKGGKSKAPSMQEQLAAQQQMIEMSRPKDIPLQTTGWGGMGYNIPKNAMEMGTPITGQGLAPPSWMQGDWAMPAWGQQAPNVGAAMLQQQQGAPSTTAPPTTSQTPQSNAGQLAKDFLNWRAGGRRGGKGHLVTEPNGAGYWSILPQQWEQRQGIGVNPAATQAVNLQNLLAQWRAQGQPQQNTAGQV